MSGWPAPNPADRLPLPPPPVSVRELVRWVHRERLLARRVVA